MPTLALRPGALLALAVATLLLIGVHNRPARAITIGADLPVQVDTILPFGDVGSLVFNNVLTQDSLPPDDGSPKDFVLRYQQWISPAAFAELSGTIQIGQIDFFAAPPSVQDPLLSQAKFSIRLGTSDKALNQLEEPDLFNAPLDPTPFDNNIQNAQVLVDDVMLVDLFDENTGVLRFRGTPFSFDTEGESALLIEITATGFFDEDMNLLPTLGQPPGFYQEFVRRGPVFGDESNSTCASVDNLNGFDNQGSCLVASLTLPEPSTGLCLAMGLVALAAGRRRARR